MKRPSFVRGVRSVAGEAAHRGSADAHDVRERACGDGRWPAGESAQPGHELRALQRHSRRRQHRRQLLARVPLRLAPRLRR